MRGLREIVSSSGDLADDCGLTGVHAYSTRTDSQEGVMSNTLEDGMSVVK